MQKNKEKCDTRELGKVKKCSRKRVCYLYMLKRYMNLLLYLFVVSNII